MENELKSSNLPEEIEYEKKLSELDALEDQLAQLELKFQNISYELKEFELKYLQTVGVRFARLDEIKSKIIEVLSQLNPEDLNLKEEVDKVRTTAQESAQAVGEAQEEIKSHQPITHNDSIKSLYRELAKKFHPDLAIDDEEREKRTRYMIEINEAYQNGDENRLKRILSEYEVSPDSVMGEGIGAELVRLIRKISQVQKRINEIILELEQIKQTEIFRLRQSYIKAELAGKNILDEMVKQIDEMIFREEKRLKSLLRELETTN